MARDRDNGEGSSHVQFADNIDLSQGGFAYDPDQNSEEKRQVRRGYRNLAKTTEDPDAVQNADDLSKKVDELNSLFAGVKNPQEATLDAERLLAFSNIGAKQARALKSGPSAFDIDDFVSKLVVFMGGAARQDQDSDLDLEDNDTPLNWDKIGRKALAKSRRVPVMDFMLGPLAIEQKKRAQTKRTAKLRKDEKERTKPQEIREEDIQRSENETTKNVATILSLLEGTGSINFFKFIVNPDTGEGTGTQNPGFAQTVENLFYLSFLVRDGKCAFEVSEENLEPIIYACEPPAQNDYDQGLKKQQHVMEIDVDTWKTAIEMFNITEAIIPPREVKDVAFNSTNPAGKWQG